MKARNASIGLILAALWATHSHAAVTVNCTASAGGIAFGIYNPLSAVANVSTGTLQVTCNGTGNGKTQVTLNVTLSTGLSGSYATRTMFSGVNTLNYNIFSTAAYTQIIGDGSGGTVAGSVGPFRVTAGGGNVVETETFYGRIPASQDVAPGSYSDVITVTVTY
jgi:spore coat protein U-like protein